MSQCGQKIIWSPYFKSQWDEKQNPQLSFNSNAPEQVALLISVQNANKQFIISSHNHNSFYAYIIPSLESFNVLYEASHFCNICDITPKLLMTSVAERLNDLCKVTHQFRWSKPGNIMSIIISLNIAISLLFAKLFVATLWAGPA